MRKSLLVAVLVCAWAAVAAAQELPREAAQPIRPQPSGMKSQVTGSRGKAPVIGQVYIGDLAPDFVLDASTGKQAQLSKLRGRWTLLTFADRYRDLRAYDSLDVQAHDIGAHVVGVCHEKQQTLTAVTTRDKVHMLLLADATGEVSAIYGLYDWGNALTEPGFFVLDPQGTVRLAIIGRLFPADQMLEMLKFATSSME
jgi:peroxiredoxin